MICKVQEQFAAFDCLASHTTHYSLTDLEIKKYTYLDVPDTCDLWRIVGGEERCGEGAFVSFQCTSTL